MQVADRLAVQVAHAEEASLIALIAVAMGSQLAQIVQLIPD
jgi:hypothetical protein